jgi:hypothetical protein
MNESSGRDLEPLDPSADTERWERMVAGINRAAADEITRRASASDPGVIALLSSWRRPAAAFYAAIAAGAAAILLVQPGGTSPGTGVAAALGYAEPVAAWVEADLSPSVEELLFAMEPAE